MHVLLIDDDKRLRALLVDYLGQSGVQVTEAGAFDAVLLDIMMPGMNGLEV